MINNSCENYHTDNLENMSKKELKRDAEQSSISAKDISESGILKLMMENGDVSSGRLQGRDL